MQGYILHIHRVKEEDMIVHILTEHALKSTYRFYGARHSTIHIGYKIDFEPHYNIKSSLPQLRNILHLAHPWNAVRERMLLWQQFVVLFYPHLKELGNLEGFYLELLDWCAARWAKQNPKRIALEAYVRLLANEGRLHDEFKCFLCNENIDDSVSLARGFLPAHPKCLHMEGLQKKLLKEFFTTRSSLNISDEAIERLWRVLLEGL